MLILGPLDIRIYNLLVYQIYFITKISVFQEAQKVTDRNFIINSNNRVFGSQNLINVFTTPIRNT